MPDDESKLRLNSLERYRKASPRLVLEEYGHCEVPAGCGGVVLRWRDGRPGWDFRLQGACRAEAIEAWFDGRPIPEGAFFAGPGGHVLALHLRSAEAGLIRVAVLATALRPLRSDPPAPLVSRADSSWRARGTDPGAGWQEPGFDDRAWPAMARAEVTGEEPPWTLTRVLEVGGEELTLPGSGRELWVRGQVRVEALGAPGG